MLNSIRSLAVLLMIFAVGGCDLDTTNQAEVRLLNASLDYDSLDLYVDDDREADAIAYGGLSNYVDLDDDTYTIAFAVHGSSSKLESLSETLAEDSHTTYVGYGRSGAFSVIEIDEDQDEPDSGEAKLLALNAATDAGAVDVYLTDNSTALENASPLFSDVGTGAAADEGYVTLNSGTYRLRVTAAGSTSDVRLDISGVQLGSEQVSTLVVADTSGGVLVNAMLLPQQGSLTALTNPKARVRAVIGAADGASVTASIDDTTLVSGVQTKTIGAYELIDAGAQPVSLSIDGESLAFSDPTLVAGNDYTLLVWSDASGTQMTLIDDDNRLPLDDSDAKIRVLNSMSELAAPISLAVDFYPVAENIAVGQASSFTELTSTTDSQLDVTNASTSAALYTQTDTSLLAQGVYTLFMFGGETTATARLRKDR